VRIIPRAEVGYVDGTVYGNAIIKQIITANAVTLSVVCFSSLTANHGASLALASLAKTLNPRIVTVFGNDHFSALANRIMLNQPVVDYGFYGNDVVEGFASFVSDYLTDRLSDLSLYHGLVYRRSDQVQQGVLPVLGDARQTGVHRNSENPTEYGRLPLVDYSLMDSALPHREKYLAGQQKVYFFMREGLLKSQVIDIGRGCIKFAGERVADIPCNACDFCGIIPGVKPITMQSAERAWQILKNAYDQGYNYFYITADELPLTMWAMLRRMADHQPEWYRDLRDKPRMFGYARAEGFETQPEKIDTLVRVLGFNHFFIGFDGLSEISLKSMNKQSVNPRYLHKDMVQQNLIALRSVVASDCLVTAGLVVTHLGITPDIMAENYALLQEVVDAHPTTFAALDFGPLCPIPGSQSFRYLTHPEVAEAKATELGLRVNRSYLESVKGKYLDQDCFDMNEMVHDFIEGCCPDITQADVDEHLAKITDLANRHHIVVGGGV
jgi:anaerobic magnesium-protoporphyrin IX monomethyl ester cyclase